MKRGKTNIIITEGRRKTQYNEKIYREEHKEEVKLMMKNWYNNTK